MDKNISLEMIPVEMENAQLVPTFVAYGRLGNVKAQWN